MAQIIPSDGATPPNADTPIACEFIKGATVLPGQRVSTWQVNGVDGFGWQKHGLGDSSFRFLLIKYGTVSAVESWRISVTALQGSRVDINDDWNVTTTGCVILQMGPLLRSVALGPGPQRGEIEIGGRIIPGASALVSE